MANKPGWWFARGRACMVAVALLGALLAPGARADVQPGDRITDQNIDKVKDLISPGMEWCIKHGWPITITETKRIESVEVFADHETVVDVPLRRVR